MKNILFAFFVLSLTIFPLKGYSQINSQISQDSLIVKVETLSHDLDYLKLTYEIYVLNTDIKIITMEIGNQIKDIKMSLYHRDFDRDMYRQYKELYNVYRDNLESTKKLIASKQDYLIVKVLTGNLTEGEKDLLYQSHGMTDGLYRQAELSLDMMKSALDLYYKYM